MRMILVLLTLSVVACDQTHPHSHAVFIPTPLPAAPAVQPTANVVDGPLTIVNNGSGFSVSGTVTNVGTRCARAVSGQINFGGQGFAQTLQWALPVAQTLRPSESARYATCCLPLSVSGQNLGYLQLVSQESITCP